MMKSMKLKRIVLTGAAVTVMMSFAAPAMALPPREIDTSDLPPLTVDPPPDPPVPPICIKYPVICDHPDLPPLTLDPTDAPTADPPPPPPDTPPASPPANPNPPDNTEVGGGSNAGGSSNIGSSSNVGSAVSGNYGTESSGSGIFDRGGVFVSDLLPSTFTSTLNDSGNSVKKNLPASVANSLPDTGGGWSFLLLAAGALVAGGVVFWRMARRTTSVTHSAH
jgi:LPXTG-motif cell wall-anchored protein